MNNINNISKNPNEYLYKISYDRFAVLRVSRNVDNNWIYSFEIHLKNYSYFINNNICIANNLSYSSRYEALFNCKSFVCDYLFYLINTNLDKEINSFDYSGAFKLNEKIYEENRQLILF